MDVKLSTGKVVDLDLHKISVKELREFFSPQGTAKQEDEILCKVTGLSLDALLEMSPPDYRLLTISIYKAWREPLANPNSVSKSTSGSRKKK